MAISGAVWVAAGELVALLPIQGHTLSGNPKRNDEPVNASGFVEDQLSEVIFNLDGLFKVLAT